MLSKIIYFLLDYNNRLSNLYWRYSFFFNLKIIEDLYKFAVIAVKY